MTELIRASVLAGFDDLVLRLGGEPATLMRRFHLEGVDPDSATALVPYVNVVRLIEAAADELGTPDFGLQLAHYQRLDRLGPLALLVTNCSTVGAAIETLAENMHTYSPSTTLRLIRPSRGPVCVEYDITAPLAASIHRLQKTEFSLLFLTKTLHMLIGPHFQPLGILFRHQANKPLAIYREHFDVIPQFGAEMNAVELSPRDLDQPLEIVAPTMRRAIDEYLRPMIDRQPLSVERQVMELIARLLPAGQCRLATVAAQLSMHERTLQRHLSQSGRIFEDMVDQIRSERALELLGDSRIPLSHVGGMLGYSEQSTFTRACRRWFARTPGAQRRQLAQARMSRAGELAGTIVSALPAS